jgi:hypothetical protein
MRTRRDIQVFSLSFLDCICCAFGAIILLFVLSKFGEPLVIEQTRTDLDAAIVRLEEETHDIRGTSLLLEREIEAKRLQMTEARENLARLQGDLSTLKGEFAAARENAAVQNIIEGRMARTLQDLTAEMKRLAARRPAPPSASVGGIPVDSEYIIFIIDTSGSMQRGAWGSVQQKLRETLNVYPKVKGLQIMNDMGDYMFPQYRGRWIPDTARRRRVILETLATWQPFSNSSPVEGIAAAIRAYHDPQKKISLYVFGDEYSGKDMQAAIRAVDHLNRAGPGGQRKVRIHAVGFPTVLSDPRGITGIRFATLMRAMCERNGGAFVGLNRARP